MQRSKGSMQKKSKSNFRVVIVKRTWFAAQICFQLMHGVLSYKLDFIIWRIRDSCLRKICRCWSSQVCAISAMANHSRTL